MFTKFKRFDVHVKAVDGVNQKTILGACITIISAAVVIILVLSELNLFLKVDVISRMVADNTVGIESVRLDFGNKKNEHYIICRMNYFVFFLRCRVF